MPPFDSKETYIAAPAAVCITISLVLRFTGGQALEHHATRRASAVVDALARRMPATAHRKTAAGITEIALAHISLGELLLVLPHEICPADGVVVSGNGSMD